MPPQRPVPEEASEEVVLRDGSVIRLRPVTPADRPRLEALFQRLSPHSRYLRFHHARRGVSTKEAAAMAFMQPPGRAAFVATAGEGVQERIAALGEWQRLPGGEAEIAFTVDDTLQVRGIGTALLERLAETAMRYGIKQFVALVLPENTGMFQVFEDSGLPVTKRLEDGVYTLTLDLEEQGEFAQRHERREHIARVAGVRLLLYPRSVAVIGASREPRSVGGALFHNLAAGGFTGELYPVNPKAQEIAGAQAYPEVGAIPGEVDLAVLVVPAERVLEVADQCGRKGVRGLLVISAGFAETDEAGRQRQAALRQKALAYGMRVVGPNCLGILNNDPAVRLNATFSPVTAPAGNVAVGAESGAVGLAVLDYARSIGLGVSQFVSLGNRVDISSNDLLELWEEDEGTQVIVLYLESFGNPRKFSRIARRVSRKKPIVAVKAGRSAAGAKAAASHTGALAASDVAADALFAQAGVIRVNTIAELFNTTRLLAQQPPPRGRRVGILTNAGGLGVMAADACEGAGLEVPPLGQETQAQLRGFLGPAAAVSNPVDAIASATEQQYERALSLILDEPGIDAALALYIPPRVTRPEEIAGAIRRTRVSHGAGKPLLAGFTVADGARPLQEAMGREVPCYTFPEDAVQALARAVQYAGYRQRPEGGPLPSYGADAERARALLAPGAGSRWLIPEAAQALLREYGIPVAAMRVVSSAEDAAGTAREMGFPVALKLRSPSIVHKTEVGGVVLGLRSEEEVRQAYRAMERRLEALGRRHEMEGAIVQAMARGGQEMIVGMSHDPVFGPLIMAGLGGVFVELLKDVAFALHPLSTADPERMLAQLKGLPLLQGWRGAPPRDVAAVQDVLLRFSALVEDLPEIEEMEMNPLIVLERGQGCVAVDARVLVRET